MALERTRSGHLLPCGRHVEDVLDELDTRAISPHTRDCPHCTTARHGIEALNEATRALLDDPAEPPPGLLDRIMTAVRAEVRRGDGVALPTEHGPAEISTRAVASLLRYAADTVPGVRARRCRLIATERADTVRIEMSLSLRYGSAMDELVDQVRQRLATAMSGHIGLFTDTIDVEIVDLWDEPRA
jgi:uncharacterized alkaline shock family protein YloU